MNEEVIEIATKTKKKRETPEDFIGWKSPDGKLEVIGIAGRTGKRNHVALFKVTCTECSKDSELFPDGYFVSNKSNLIRGAKPCGCGRSPRYKDWQFLILARRAAKGRFVVHGFAEEFHGQNTKLNLECLKDGNKWSASINNIINKKSGCWQCSKVTLRLKFKTLSDVAFENCKTICKEMNYEVVGFVDGYKNQRSRFEYICKIHGKQNVSYNNFVNKGSRCGGCVLKIWGMVMDISQKEKMKLIFYMS